MSEEKVEDRERVQISVAQAVASVLATVSAAVLCSFFGVAGTIIGTAVTSLVATVGGALYSYSLRRTQARLRRLHQAGAASPPLREILKTARQQGRAALGRVPWAPITIGSLTVFVFSIGLITLIEANAGKTLSALLGVGNSGGRETTLGSLTDTGHKRHHHAAKPSPSPSNTPSPTPTPTPSPTTSPSPQGSVSPSPTSTATTPGSILRSLFPSSSG